MMCSPGPFRRSFGAITACLAAAALVGCANSGAAGGAGGSAGTSTGGSTGGGGTGGSSIITGTGGVVGAGGITGAGGVTGTGGSSGTGGTSGSGGIIGTGGSWETGGTSSSGGITGRGGVTGAGGASSSGGIAGTGGTSSAGGAKGGASGTGGTSTAGGITGTGGLPGAGGATGGATGSGGTSSGAGGTSTTCPPATPLTGGKQYCSNSKGSAGGSYAYELWSNGTGTGCMTVYGVDASFSATWTSVGDFLARIGLGFDQTKTPAQIGTISSDFAETKTGTTGLVYVGIYGWTVSPLREYYIIEDWGSSKPAGVASDGTPRTSMGTIAVDGDAYDVWKHTQTNKPAITGDNQTFDQYFSVRQTARQCGHIAISQHFSQWAGLGLQLGNLEEAKLLVEAQNGSGTIAFTTATVVVK